jgi:hypothetical protein
LWEKGFRDEGAKICQSIRGAGRLPLAPGKKVKGFMLSPEVIEPLRLRAKSEGWGESYFIELALRQALGLQN